MNVIGENVDINDVDGVDGCDSVIIGTDTSQNDDEFNEFKVWNSLEGNWLNIGFIIVRSSVITFTSVGNSHTSRVSSTGAQALGTKRLVDTRVTMTCRNVSISDLVISVCWCSFLVRDWMSFGFFCFGLGDTSMFVHRSCGPEKYILLIECQISLWITVSGITIIGVNVCIARVTSLTLVLFWIRVLVLRVRGRWEVVLGTLVGKYRVFWEVTHHMIPRFLNHTLIKVS